VLLLVITSDAQNLLKKLEDLYDRWENAVRASDTIQTIATSENIHNISEDIEDLLLDLEETIRMAIDPMYSS
jgi:deoxyadenosine/deoxycytidine kinase